MAALTLTEGSARLLSFFFYVLAARALDPTGFGIVRYTLTIVLIGFVLLQVIVKAIARELGAARGDELATRDLLGSSVVFSSGLLVLTAATCAVAGDAGLLGGVDVSGLVVALIGYTTFQVYYAMARGVGETKRPALAYVGGSALQLIAFGAIDAAGGATPRIALFIYGLSSIVPIVLCELWRPIVVGRQRVTRAAMQKLMATAWPLVLGQIGFIVWNSADQVWVQGQLGTRDIGLYGAARNMSQLFIVIPTGIGVALLPRIAELRSGRASAQARKLVLYATLGVTAITAGLAVLVIVFRATLLNTVYGASYAPASGALLLQAIGMVFYSGFATLTGAAVGWGWPRLSVVGIIVAACMELAGLGLLPADHLITPAGAFAGSMGVAFAVVFVWAAIRGPTQLRLPTTEQVPT